LYDFTRTALSVSQAIDNLLEKGAKTVVITSTEVEEGKLVLLAKNRDGKNGRRKRSRIWPAG
jgi:pyridoxal/pyridoxine/pyridoxamine kinase